LAESKADLIGASSDNDSVIPGEERNNAIGILGCVTLNELINHPLNLVDSLIVFQIHLPLVSGSYSFLSDSVAAQCSHAHPLARAVRRCDGRRSR
jgi:hypothetical protein